MVKMNKVKLGDMLTFQRGYDLTHTQMKGGKIPVVGSSEIIGWHNEVKVEAPALLIGRSGTVGRPQFYETEIWAHNTTLFVSDFHGNNPKFCFYFLKNLNLEDFANSSGVPTLNRNFIHPLIVNFPNLPTQTAIARILSSLDDKIELNNKINKELENLARTIYEYWFVQNKEETWEKKKIEEVASLQYGYPFNTKFFNNEQIGLSVIRIRDILENTVSVYTTEENINEKYKLNIGDLLIGMDGNFHINHWCRSDCYLNQRVVRIRKNKLNTFIIKYQIEPYIKQKENAGSGSTVGHLSDKDVKNLEIVVPPQNLLSKFNKQFDNILSKILSNQEEAQNLVQLRDFLLPLLMNGQVTVGNNVSKTETEAKVIQVVPATATNKQDNKDRVFKRLVLSAYLLDNICNEPTAGRVKFEKLLYLSEHCAQVPLQSEFKRAAAGPYDSKALYSLEKQLKNSKWFEKKTDKNRSKYVRSEKVNGYKQYYETVFSVEQKGVLDKLIRLLKKANTEQCEIVATLYGAWNDFLIKNIQPTDEQIVEEVLTNWHDAKKRISQKRWLDALIWMKKNDIVPIGYGVVTK